MIVILASIATVLAIPLLGVAAFYGRESASPTIQVRRIKRPKEELSSFRENELSTSVGQRVIVPALQKVSQSVGRITPVGLVDGTAQKLVVAGLATKLPLEAFVGLKLVVASIFGLASFFFVPVDSFLTKVGVAGLACVAGFVIPDASVNRKVAARQIEIKAALPEVLDQLTVIVEAGLSFDAALSRVVNSSQGPLVEEFARALRSIRLGLSRGDALTGVSDRTGVPEVRQFVAAIKQADELGVPLARILRTQSVHMRELKRLAAEEQAMRLPVKLVFPMVFCMLPALFVVLLGPVAIRIMSGDLSGS